MKFTSSDIVVGNYSGFKDGQFYFYANERFNLNKDILKKMTKIEAIAYMDYLIDYEFIMFSGAWGKLYKKSLFDGIRYPLGRYAEDQFTTWRLYLQAQSIAWLGEVVYAYRMRPGSLSRTFDLSHLDYMDALEERKAVVSKIDGYDMAAFQQLYDYVGKRMLADLKAHGYDEEYLKLQKKIADKGY